MKFLVDMPLSPRLVEWLNEQGHPSMHAVEAGLAQASDEHVLEYARSQGQIIITADLDYPRLLALTGEATPGIILFRGGDYSERSIPFFRFVATTATIVAYSATSRRTAEAGLEGAVK